MPPDGGNTPPNGRGQRKLPREQQAPEAGPRGQLRPFGLGSGFIVAPGGYIVTNAHVVENAEVITVRPTHKREFKAKAIGTHTPSDVAGGKIDATARPTG